MRIPRLLAVLSLAAALPTLAWAGQVQVTSSTQYLRYADFLSDTTDQQDLAQYLRLNATFGEKDAIRVQGYGRLVGQLTDDVEVRNQLARHLYGRLYYLTVDWRDAVPGHLDLRAGRSFVGSATLPGIVDGLSLQVRDLGAPGLGATAFGGRRVFLDNKSELPFDDDWLMGASVSYDAALRSRAEVGYARELRAGALAREAVALDLTTTPVSMVSLTGRAQWDLVSSRASELLAAVKVAPVLGLVLRGEVFQSAPIFDRDSFYRSFGVEHYLQALVGAEWRWGAPLRLNASYARERFDKDESADVLEAGVVVHVLEPLVVDVAWEHRSGYAGRIGGVRGHAAWSFSRAVLAGGVDYDDFRRQDSRDGTAKKYWASLTLDLAKGWSVAVRGERNETFLFNHSSQGWLLLDAHL
jgi:hypothetical protein